MSEKEDPLDGFRGRTPDQIKAIVDNFDYLAAMKVDQEAMRHFDLGMEVKERLNTDRVIRLIHDSFVEQKERLIQDFLSKEFDEEAARVVHASASGCQYALGVMNTAIQVATNIAKTHDLEQEMPNE